MASTPSSSLLAPTPIPSGSRNNPIVLRIYKAVRTNFDDAASREALEIASGFYSSTSTSAGTRTHEVDVEGSGSNGKNIGLGIESGSKEQGEGTVNGTTNSSTAEGGLPIQPIIHVAPGQTAAAARKGLKRDVERRLASGSQKFLEAFGKVDEKLSVLRTHMQEMQVRCDQVQAQLDLASSGTKQLLERADGLRSQRSLAQLRSSLVELFLARFTLSEKEVNLLTTRDLEMSPELFKALDRVEEIRRDCRALLGGEEGKVQAGLDIMAATSAQLEAGYNKIHRWCQYQFRHLNKDQIDVSSVMREAVSRLRRRPALLNDALSVLTATRQSTVLNSFLQALTRGGPNGLPRPIELHAHDPTRYVGDMLAWVHQATAGEHELLDALFNIPTAQRMVGAQRASTTDPDTRSEEEKMVAMTLDKNLEGLGRPLRMRIQQTIKSQEGIIMTYKIANLVQFYLVTMKKTIGADALLTKALEEIYDSADMAFFDALDAQGRSLLRFLHPPDATLAPPVALRDACQVLREIIAVYDTSLVDEAERENDFARVLDGAVGPAIEMCERMGEMRKSTGGGEWERDVFLVNCLTYLKHTLEPYPFTAPRVSQLNKQIGKHVESMTFDHHGKLLDQSGLAPIMRTIRTRPSDTPLSRLPATDAKQITSSLSTFTTFLSSIDVHTHPRLSLLQDPRLAESIHRSALRHIAEAYSEICDKILDKKEGYEFAETLLRRSKDEVEVALGIAEE